MKGLSSGGGGHSQRQELQGPHPARPREGGAQAIATIGPPLSDLLLCLGVKLQVISNWLRTKAQPQTLLVLEAVRRNWFTPVLQGQGASSRTMAECGACLPSLTPTPSRPGHLPSSGPPPQQQRAACHQDPGGFHTQTSAAGVQGGVAARTCTPTAPQPKAGTFQGHSDLTKAH